MTSLEELPGLPVDQLLLRLGTSHSGLSSVPTTARVLRDKVKWEVRLSEIVPGDIVFLSAGDIVLANSRVINANVTGRVWSE